jgi:hypothetical protein
VPLRLNVPFDDKAANNKKEELTLPFGASLVQPLTGLDHGGQALDRSSRVRIAQRSDRFAMLKPQGSLAGKVPQVVSVIYVQDQRGLF